MLGFGPLGSLPLGGTPASEETSPPSGGGLNTRDKRASAINVSSPWRALLPTPGAQTASDRYQVGFMYRFGESGTTPVEVEQRQPGGGYPVRPIIYLDKHGKPVDLKTYRKRVENKALQATKQAVKAAEPEDRAQAQEAARQLREAISSGVSERIAQEARAASEILTQLRALLAELEQIALQEAEDEEALLILLLAA